MVKIKQLFEHAGINDVRYEISKQLIESEVCDYNYHNKMVAVAVGSRGIKNLDVIVKEVLLFLKSKGAYPFIVPAMGSHGNADADGQKQVLNSYGINEETMGVPVISDMETVTVGKTESGIEVFTDRHAFEADMIVVVNRVKAHTDFKGEIESGLCKMLAIGLGKEKGCTTLHEHGTMNFPRIIPDVGSFLIERLSVAFGVAIVEDAYDNTSIIKVLPAEEIIEGEKKLLKISKTMMPKIMIPEIDVLIVERFGKDVSGAGMDPNITGRASMEGAYGFKGPDIKRIIVLDLTEESHGNACGICCADFITRKFFEKIDFDATYKNSIACFNPRSSQIPMIAENEEDALKLAVRSCRNIDFDTAKIVRIKDTLALGEIYVSENLIEAAGKNKMIQIIG